MPAFRYNSLLSILLWCGILLVSCAFLFAGLGNDPLIDYDEAAYAEIVAEQEVRGERLSLTFLNLPWYEKPPLYYWLVGASRSLFGTNEFATRAPSAAAGVATVLLVGLIAYEITRNRSAVFMSSVSLLMMGSFLDSARQVRIDIVVTATILFALYAYLRGLRDPRWYIGIGIAVGLGVMLKSVIGLFAGIPLLIVSVLMWQFAWLRSKYLWWGVGLGVLIALPWHLYQSFRVGSEFWSVYLGRHVFERFGSDVLGGAPPWYTYFEMLWYGLPIWSIVFAVVAIVLGIRFVFDRSPAIQRSLSFALSAIAFFVIFALAETRVSYYLTPLYPFMALAIGCGIFALFKTSHRSVTVLILVLFNVAVGFAAPHAVSMAVHTDTRAIPEYAIAEANKKVGLILKERGATEAYVYAYDRLNTITYYSGNATMYKYLSGAVPSEFYLITQPGSMLPELLTRSYLVFESEHVTLLNVKKE